MNTSTSNLIIGMGEVGMALSAVLQSPAIDIVTNYDTPADTIHIAFPFSSDFSSQVLNYQSKYQAKYVVVHSTVPVGTCDRYSWIHSPVRGRHPSLVRALMISPKWFAGEDCEIPAEYWTTHIGPTRTTDRAVTTEIGKLYELLSFGVNIAVEKAVHEACSNYGGNYYEAYQAFAEDYNSHYGGNNFPRFTRPVLSHVSGPIGGHCVRENMDLIELGIGEELAGIVKRLGYDLWGG